MTLEQLNSYRKLQTELAEAKDSLAALQAAVGPGAQVITDMPHTPGYQDKLGNLVPEIAEATEEIKRLSAKIAGRQETILRFIQSIPDYSTRQVFRLRFLRALTWGQVAEVIGGGNTASSVRMICFRQMNVHTSRTWSLRDEKGCGDKEAASQ